MQISKNAQFFRIIGTDSGSSFAPSSQTTVYTHFSVLGVSPLTVYEDCPADSQFNQSPAFDGLNNVEHMKQSGKLFPATSLGLFKSAYSEKPVQCVRQRNSDKRYAEYVGAFVAPGESYKDMGYYAGQYWAHLVSWPWRDQLGYAYFRLRENLLGKDSTLYVSYGVNKFTHDFKQYKYGFQQTFQVPLKVYTQKGIRPDALLDHVAERLDFLTRSFNTDELPFTITANFFRLEGDDKGVYVRPKDLPPKDVCFPELRNLEPHFRRLAAEAYTTVEFFTGNGIALASDLKELKESAVSTLNTIKGLRGSRRYKAISQLYLSFHYGWRLLASDISDLNDGLKSFLDLTSVKRRCQASGHLTDARGTTYNLRYQQYYEYMGQLTHLLDRFSNLMDLSINSSNIWDMIPYSFVVDWFTNIGDIADQIDSWYNMVHKHKLLYYGQSVKAILRTEPAKLGILGCAGFIEVSYYHRWYNPRGLMPSLSFQFDFPTSATHVVEAGALIVSRK